MRTLRRHYPLLTCCIVVSTVGLLVLWNRRKRKPDAKFVFDVARLQDGDIILSTNPFTLTMPAFKSLAIRLVTRSCHSHAAIFVKTGYLVEAVGSGVVRLSISGALVEDGQNVEVLRLIPKSGSAQKAARAAHCAELQVSHRYATLAALCSVFPGLEGPNKHEHFCSHLIAGCYEQAGSTLVPGKPSGKVTPQDLRRSALLRRITDDVIRPASERSELPLLPFGDGSSTDETLLEREVVEKTMAKLLDLEPEPVPSTLPELADFTEQAFTFHNLGARCDQALLESLQELGWIERHDEIINDTSAQDLFRYVQSHPIQGASYRAAFRDLLTLFEHSWTKANAARYGNYVRCNDTHQRTGMKAFKYLADDFFKMWTSAEALLGELRTTIRTI